MEQVLILSDLSLGTLTLSYPSSHGQNVWRNSLMRQSFQTSLLVWSRLYVEQSCAGCQELNVPTILVMCSYCCVCLRWKWFRNWSRHFESLESLSLQPLLSAFALGPCRKHNFSMSDFSSAAVSKKDKTFVKGQKILRACVIWKSNEFQSTLFWSCRGFAFTFYSLINRHSFVSWAILWMFPWRMRVLRCECKSQQVNYLRCVMWSTFISSTKRAITSLLQRTG